MDIEKIAEIAGKCGMKVHKFMCLPPIVSSFDAKPNEMIAYTNEIMELCAIACENLKEQDYCVDVRGGAEAIRNLKG